MNDLNPRIFYFGVLFLKNGHFDMLSGRLLKTILIVAGYPVFLPVWLY
jgi:hypothetical protein